MLCVKYDIGKRVLGAAKGGAYGGKWNMSSDKNKNPFQLATTIPSDAQQQPQSSNNPFSSVPQTSKQPLFTVQSEHLFKSSGNEISKNPFITSSAPSSQSSFPSVNTSSAPIGGRSYAQVLKTGGRNLNDPRLEQSTSVVFTADANLQDSQSEKHHTSQNPFAKPSSFKFQSPRHMGGAQSKVHPGPSRPHGSAPPTTHQYMVTLSVRNIDQQMCKPDILRSHFQQFGDVCDLKCMPRKGMATVSYSDHVSHTVIM